MARLSREQSGTGIYHVMLRGINRQNKPCASAGAGSLGKTCLNHQENRRRLRPVF